MVVFLLRSSAKIVLEKKILQKEITERKQAEEQLQKAYDELDIRVRERTFDLAEANKLLMAEIAERKRTEEKLQHYSERDHLTMLYNRRKFFELLETEVSKAKRYARPLTIIMLDIDYFKKVNDNYGHNIGDMVLKTTANIVGDIIRKDDIFARYGGEEFMLLSPETGLEEAIVMVERIRVAVETHSYTAGVRITISAGVAEWSGEETELAFIKKADEMLYMAKNTGRNRVEAAERPSSQGSAD
jgi:diguanylate cyclase (GGDEF)-like protein